MSVIYYQNVSFCVLTYVADREAQNKNIISLKIY